MISFAPFNYKRVNKICNWNDEELYVFHDRPMKLDMRLDMEVSKLKKDRALTKNRGLKFLLIKTQKEYLKK